MIRSACLFWNRIYWFAIYIHLCHVQLRNKNLCIFISEDAMPVFPDALACTLGIFETCGISTCFVWQYICSAPFEIRWSALEHRLWLRLLLDRCEENAFATTGAWKQRIIYTDICEGIFQPNFHSYIKKFGTNAHAHTHIFIYIYIYTGYRYAISFFWSHLLPLPLARSFTQSSKIGVAIWLWCHSACKLECIMYRNSDSFMICNYITIKKHHHPTIIWPSCFLKSWPQISLKTWSWRPPWGTLQGGHQVCWCCLSGWWWGWQCCPTVSSTESSTKQ